MAERAVAGGARPSKPKRTLRTVTLAVMTATLLAASALAFSLHREAAFALTAPRPVDLGAFGAADVAAHDNGFVRVHVELEAPAATFRRPLEPSHHRVAKASDGRWVVYAVPDGYAEQRFLPPRIVAGRLARASELGARFAGVADITGGDAWVLVDGDHPHGTSWLLGLEVLLVGFALFGLGGIARVLRPVR